MEKKVNVTRAKLETLIKELPDPIDIEEVMYRLYLLQKIETGEVAIVEGKTLAHDEAMNRLSRKWQN